jgi:hypothetical protein
MVVIHDHRPTSRDNYWAHFVQLRLRNSSPTGCFCLDRVGSFNSGWHEDDCAASGDIGEVLSMAMSKLALSLRFAAPTVGPEVACDVLEIDVQTRASMCKSACATETALTSGPLGACYLSDSYDSLPLRSGHESMRCEWCGYTVAVYSCWPFSVRRSCLMRTHT